MTDKPNFGGLMKKAQAMQKKMQEMQKKIAAMEVEGKAGIDKAIVKVTMDGQHQCKKVWISPTLLRTDDESKEMLEDLIASAFNDACSKIESEAKKMMSGMMGNMQMPTDFGGMMGE